MNFLKFKNILLCFIMLLYWQNLSANTCERMFSLSPEVKLYLPTYLRFLIEKQAIAREDLERYLKGNVLLEDVIRSNKKLNTIEISEYTNGLKSAKFMGDVADWESEVLAIIEAAKISEEKIIQDRDMTQNAYFLPMIFHPIPPGTFMMGEGQEEKEVTLTHRTEWMSTKVTQSHWAKLMGANPSRFKGIHNFALDIDGKKIKMQGDHPVESVTWFSALVFANRLSEEHGLKPVYDFSAVKFKPVTSAEEGTLDNIESGEIKINAPDGDYYQAEGYRLPTEAEHEYVRKNLGTANGKYYFGDDETELKNHAWFDKNSNGMTHSVGELEPLIINGNKFYDLYGNVNEWGFDSVNGPDRVLRGGSWFEPSRYGLSAFRYYGPPADHDSFVGFRLLRTLP